MRDLQKKYQPPRRFMEKINKKKKIFEKPENNIRYFCKCSISKTETFNLLLLIGK